MLTFLIFTKSPCFVILMVFAMTGCPVYLLHLISANLHEYLV